MSHLSDIDREKRNQFLQHAAFADSMARKTHNPADRITWREIAVSYRDMADRITRQFKL
jgi:hypothetical protein